MAKWGFLTNHARTLICIAQDPGVRLRDIALALGITEGGAYRIVSELTEAGYLAKVKLGRRNRYSIEADLPLPGPFGTHRTVGEVLKLLVDPRLAKVHGQSDDSGESDSLHRPLPP